jgi:hypothetical protein
MKSLPLTLGPFGRRRSLFPPARGDVISSQRHSRNKEIQGRVTACIHPTSLNSPYRQRVQPPLPGGFDGRNGDVDVRKDMIDIVDKLAPENVHYRYNAEGSDDIVFPIPRFPFRGEVADCCPRISWRCWSSRVSGFQFWGGS